jgi:hypothetical protein
MVPRLQVHCDFACALTAFFAFPRFVRENCSLHYSCTPLLNSDLALESSVLKVKSISMTLTNNERS